MPKNSKYEIGYQTKYGYIINKIYKGPSINWELRCICGKIYYALSSELNQNRKQSCGCKNSKYYIGYIFGNNCEIIKFIGRNKLSNRIFECKCGCGNTFITNGSEISHRKSCGCSYKKQYCGDMSGEYWNRLIYGAKRRNISFEISKDYVWNLFIQQNGKCKYTKLQLKWGSCDKKNNAITASLDRIDSSKGYIEGNVQWVHKIIQPMKMNMSHKKFIKLCKIISKNS